MIVYALLARGQTVLAEHTQQSGNFPTITRVLLGKIDAGTDAVHSYAYDQHVFHYIVEDGLTYLCMCDKTGGAVRRRLPFTFLQDIKQQALSRFGLDALQTTLAFGLNTQFAPVLHRQMEYYNTDPSADRIGYTQGQLDNVRDNMVENIDKVLERGEHIELLVDKSANLEQQAFRFQRQSTALRQGMWWRMIKTYVVAAAVVLLVLFFILAMSCGGVSLSSCRSRS